VLIREPAGLLCFKRDLYDPEGLRNPPTPQAFVDAREISNVIEPDLKRKTRFDIVTDLRSWHFDAAIEIGPQSLGHCSLLSLFVPLDFSLFWSIALGDLPLLSLDLLIFYSFALNHFS